jgi:hypothetical protein
MLPYSRLFSQDANLSLFSFLIISTETETANINMLHIVWLKTESNEKNTSHVVFYLS